MFNFKFKLLKIEERNTCVKYNPNPNAYIGNSWDLLGFIWMHIFFTKINFKQIFTDKNPNGIPIKIPIKISIKIPSKSVKILNKFLLIKIPIESQ